MTTKRRCEICGEKAIYKIWDENLEEYIYLCEDHYDEATLEERILSESEEF